MNDHPDTALLQSYVHNSTAAEYSSLRLHLAQCAHCRAVVHGLSGLQTLLTTGATAQDNLSEQQQQQIADYLDGHLAAADAQQQHTFIQANASAMKAALHYASQKSAMKIAPAVTKTAYTTAITQHAYVETLIAQIKSALSWQTPLWLTVPATAALVALISLNLLPAPNTATPLYAVASYQDNAVIQFRAQDNLPGIGFFAKPSQTVEPYAGVSVVLIDGRHFKIKWPAVAGALNYTLRVQQINQGAKTLVNQISTDSTSAIITPDNDDIFHRYEWLLTGTMRDAKTFISSGGFVVQQP